MQVFYKIFYSFKRLNKHFFILPIGKTQKKYKIRIQYIHRYYIPATADQV